MGQQGGPSALSPGFLLWARLVTDGAPTEWGATLWLSSAKEPLKATGQFHKEDIDAG